MTFQNTRREHPILACSVRDKSHFSVHLLLIRCHAFQPLVHDSVVVLAGVEEGRRDVSHTGTCISCSSEGCSHKFHVTCAYKRGLLHGRSARCSSCMMKKVTVPSSLHPPDLNCHLITPAMLQAAGGAVTKAPSASETPSTSLRQSRRTSQRDTRVFETSGGKKATHNCPEPGCGRE